jgi:hypothetical protein
MLEASVIALEVALDLSDVCRRVVVVADSFARSRTRSMRRGNSFVIGTDDDDGRLASLR